MRKRLEDLYDLIVRRRSIRKGISELEVHRGENEAPHFLRAIRSGSRSPESILDRDFEAARMVAYPTEECLQPYEVEEYAIEGTMAADRRAHVEACGGCDSLLAAIHPQKDK